MLKVVVQAILTFTMSCFHLPVGLYQDIESFARRFWWGQWGIAGKYIGRSGRCFVNLRKRGGGMGFKGLCKFNEALLAKQVWRLVHDKHSLLYKVLKQRISLTSPFLKLLYLLDLLLGKAF